MNTVELEWWARANSITLARTKMQKGVPFHNVINNINEKLCEHR